MASIQQFFVTPNAATPDLFARFHKRTDRQRVTSSYKPVRSNAAERAKNMQLNYVTYTIASKHGTYKMLDRCILSTVKRTGKNVKSILSMIFKANIELCVPAHLLHDYENSCTSSSFHRQL